MTYDERAEHIADLIESQLGVRGKTLDAKLRKAGRLLPRDIRRHGDRIVEAVALQASPKLSRMVDSEKALSSYNSFEKFLSDIDASERRKDGIISFLSTNVFNMLVTIGLLIAVLKWREFI